MKAMSMFIWIMGTTGGGGATGLSVGGSVGGGDGDSGGRLRDISIFSKPWNPDDLVEGVLCVFEFIAVTVDVEHAKGYRQTKSERDGDVTIRS